VGLDLGTPAWWSIGRARQQGCAALAGDPDVVAIDLAADPEILDAGTGS